jgi:hypothetical protein
MQKGWLLWDRIRPPNSEHQWEDSETDLRFSFPDWQRATVMEKLSTATRTH